MNKSAWFMMTGVCLLASVVALFLMATPAEGNDSFRVSEQVVPLAAPATFPPVVFLHDPDWPTYAQTEITVYPEPVIAGYPTQICVWVVNTSDVSQTVTIDFGVANFGIGLPFNPLGARTITVPPRAQAKACLTWVPPQSGRWCIQAILHVPGFPDQVSQRNMDISEVLQPGVPAPLTFMVRNPLTVPAPIHLEPKLNPLFTNWHAQLSFTDLLMDQGQVTPVTLIVTPPVGVKLGTRDYIVDVEATAMVQPAPQLIGGFRKIDWPPVILHRMDDPGYAESEITINPYPPLAGEPTRICVELYNQSIVPQAREVLFRVSSQLGIGLPFTPIDLQSVLIPPTNITPVCTMWIPPTAGQFGVEIILHDPQGAYLDQSSQSNLDVNEILFPGQTQPAVMVFPVRNPNAFSATMVLTTTHVDSFSDVWLDVYQLPNVPAGGIVPVTLYAKPKPGFVPEDGMLVADIEASFFDLQQNLQLIGGIRKIYHPPIPIHRTGDPPYAEREISIEPYPPRAGEPTQICVELRNPTNITQTITVEYAVANFGIGLPFQPIQVLTVTLPPNSLVKRCVMWVPPFAGHFCAQVTLIDPLQRFPPIKSQRNMDIGEVFAPGQPTQPFVFLVGNPTNQTGDIQIAPIIRLSGWQATVTPSLLSQVAPFQVRPVTLTVTPPPGVPLPQDETAVVDVEGYMFGQLLGGFRKIYRPPVPIHRPQDPPYAESEISIDPYPPREREPTEICVDVRNPTDVSQTISVTFSVANFGIGLPFHDIARPIAVTLPPHSIKRVCVAWVPPFGGQFCARVTLTMPGHTPVWSQRNMDVSEVLLPGKSSSLAFPVGNPTTRTITVTLGTVLHQDGWQVALSAKTLTNMQPNENRMVTLVVTPTTNRPMPLDGEPVVDVEGYVGRELIGGFRKIYRPPVPIHIPKDPIYAESEIYVDPYPVQVGMPTLLGAIVHNPTNLAQTITVTFGVAHWGIGLPFNTTGVLTPTMVVNIPPFGQARVQTTWVAQYQGLFCVQIQLQSAGHAVTYSQRNIDVGEPLNPQVPHSRVIEVRNPMTQTATIILGLINHRPGWNITLTPSALSNVLPGTIKQVTLTVQPSSWVGLADGEPIADVEAYINGELIGGIRKIAKPPIPLHKPQDQPYAESEISVTPYPVTANQPTTISAQVMNTSDVTQTIRVVFGVANFGMGIPFTTTGILTPTKLVTLGPGAGTTASTLWTPPSNGHWCIQIKLQDPNNQYPEQLSQRNIDVERRNWQPCQSFTKDFLMQNPTPHTVTVTLGIGALNLPAGWTYSTNITQTVLSAYQSITVTATITPPCVAGVSPRRPLLDTGGASGPIEINIEAYADGKPLVDGAGIQIQLEIAPPDKKLYLPIILK